jgi:hypothetical protein
MFAMVLGGMICDAGVTAILASHFSESDHESATTKRKIESTLQYIQSNSYGDEKQESVALFAKHVTRDLANLVDLTVFTHLSPAIRRDITSHICLSSLERSGVSASFPPISRQGIFSSTSSPFKSHTFLAVCFPDTAVLHFLTGCMSPYVAVPSECLLRKDPNKKKKTAENLVPNLSLAEVSVANESSVKVDEGLVFFVLIRGNVAQKSSLEASPTFLEPGALITNMWEDDGGEQGDRSPVSVTALSFASLFELRSDSLAAARHLFGCTPLPVSERFPAVRRPGVTPTEGESIISSCWNRKDLVAEELQNSVRKSFPTGNAAQSLERFVDDAFIRKDGGPQRLSVWKAFFAFISALRNKVHPYEEM